MSRDLATSILIAAPRSRVWSVLMDFPRYPEWNPFIRSLSGKPQVGERLEVIIQPPGRKPETFRPMVVAVEAERSFQWRGSLPIPGLFTGVHRFELSDEAGGTRFAHGEFFTGLLVPFVGGILDATGQGFGAMNEALKARC